MGKHREEKAAVGMAAALELTGAGEGFDVPAAGGASAMRRILGAHGVTRCHGKPVCARPPTHRAAHWKGEEKRTI